MIQKFDSFKLKKAGDVKIITLKIDGKAVVIDQEYPRSTTWESVPAHTSNARGAITRLTGRFMHRSFHADQLGGALETEPRYVLLDHDYTTTDGRPADKIILISWIPDTSPAVWKSTSATGAPGNSSLSHFSAMTRPCRLRLAVTNRHRHAIEQASRRWCGGRRDGSARTRRKI